MVRGAVHKKHIKVHFSRIYDLPLRNGFLIKIIILEAHGESKKYLSIINDGQRALSLSTTVHPSRVVRPMLWDLSVVIRLQNGRSPWLVNRFFVLPGQTLTLAGGCMVDVER